MWWRALSLNTLNIPIMFTVSVVIIVLALVFDYINGFHDAANSVATIVCTKVLTPFQAVCWAAFFNFLAFFIFSDHNVANTIAKVVHQEYITHAVILAGLVSAIFWNLFTWASGIPSSSSHALIGGFAGAAVAHALTFASIEGGKIGIIILFIFLAPIIGLLAALGITLLIMGRNFYKKLVFVLTMALIVFVFVPVSFYFKVGVGMVLFIFMLSEAYLYFSKATYSVYNQVFKKLQLLSSAAFSLGHGGNDAQKVMGIIAVTLMINGELDSISHMPNWIPLACYGAIGLGTLSGGWRIIKTMGTKITKVSPLEGVGSETAGAATLFVTEHLGIPVSTTHTITGAIMGVGLAKRVSAVRWKVFVHLFWAWMITIPITGFIGAVVYFITALFLD